MKTSLRTHEVPNDSKGRSANVWLVYGTLAFSLDVCFVAYGWLLTYSRFYYSGSIGLLVFPVALLALLVAILLGILYGFLGRRLAPKLGLIGKFLYGILPLVAGVLVNQALTADMVYKGLHPELPMGARAIYYLGHTSDLDVSPDGSYLLLLSNHTISILDSETGVIREIIQDTYLENNSISWAPHAELFAASTQNGWLIMDPSSLDVNEHFDGLEGPAEDLSWSPDGSMLAGVADSSSLTVWSAETGAEITSLDLDAIVTSIDSNGFEDDLAHFVWSADSSKILTCSRHGRVATWRVLDGEFLQTFAGGISQVRCQDLDWSPDGSKIAVTSFDKADIWDANIAIHLAEIEGPSYVSTWSPDSAYLAFSTTSFQLAIWDASTGETKTLIDSICGAPLYWSMQEILFAHCGYYLAIYDLSLFR